MTWSKEVEKFARGYFQTEPFRPLERAIAYYWDRKRRLVLDLFMRHCEHMQPRSPDAPRLLIDLGCGEGTDLVMIAKFVDQRQTRGADSDQPATGWRYLGLDGLPQDLEACRARMARQQITTGEARASNITKRLPLEDGEADVLYCSEVLEHIQDFDAIIREMKRVLRPGGYVIMTTPNEPNVFQRSYWNRRHRERIRAGIRRVAHEAVDINGEKVDIYGHISLHTAREWDEIFQRCGFECVDYRRGAATYGAHPFMSKSPIHEMRLAFEWLLDRLPLKLSRELSDQVIAIYRSV